MKLFITLIAFTLFAFNTTKAQHVFDDSRTTIQTPSPAYDSTFHLEAPSREHIKTGQARWVADAAGGGDASYLVYTVLLSQATDQPMYEDAVLQNTIGEMTLSRAYADEYIISCVGCFPFEKTFIISDAQFTNFNVIHGPDDTVSISGPNTFVGPDTNFAHMAIEIRVYP
jgi:hypothetical protein